MKKIFLTILILFLISISVYGKENTVINIVKIIDDDTILAKIDNNYFNIRLIGIDCFEKNKNNRTYKQAYENNLKIEDVIQKGNKSKKFLENLYINNKNKNITLDFKGVDKYGRILAIVYFDKININNELSKNSGCLIYNY